MSLPPTNNGDFKHRNKTRISNKTWDFMDMKFIWRSQTKKFGVAAIKKTCGKNGKKYKEVPPKYVTPIHREKPKPTMASNNEAEVYTSIEQAYPCLTPELDKHH
ncbi:hypothetical protein MTR_2g014125 [Medicago truncatula]|uniref:Uncharacterized protein n=1 Tax=Medicago truncatula TaxID=3880 RepID=A0A072V3F3_MEDTR|nr:hypothetical protein MTR_2g014125 [Medicago truncatula]